MSTTQSKRPLLGIVGPCASGKTTLIARLKLDGIEARHIAQEHSYVPDMWQRISNPIWLIFLDVSYPVTIRRRKLDWTVADLQEQQHRLRHARQHADLYIHTDAYSPEEIYLQVVRFLETVRSEKLSD